MKKNILFLMPALFSGGAEKQYRLIIENLKYNYNIIVILLKKSSKNFRNEEERFINLNKECQFIFVFNKELNNNSSIKNNTEKILGIFLTRNAIKKILKMKRIDYAMFSYVNQLLLVSYLNKSNIKCIFNERNTGRQICDKKYKISCLKKCYKVISNSDCAAQYIYEKGKINVEVFNNGITIENIEKRNHKGINIIVPARISKIKNQMLMLEAIQYLDFSNYNIIFVGGGDEQYIIKMKKFLQEHNNSNYNITFVGFTDNIKEYYEIADIVVLPSFEEGTPNVLLESYMYKILPLCSNIKMNLKCVNYIDLTFSPTSSLELAEKINKYSKIMSSKEVKDILENNYKFVIDNYSINKMRQKYVELFK